MHLLEIEKDLEISLDAPQGVFLPTGTTKVLIQAVRSYVRQPGKLLDLGCGSGAVGIALYKTGIVKSPLYASDISTQAVDCARKNAALNSCPVVAKCGALFSPWQHEKFDYIVDDVAGIAQEVARHSPWYRDVLCESGTDGTVFIKEIIGEAVRYLNPGGLFFFPVISLSNVQAVLRMAYDHFACVKQASHTEWPLPKEMYAHLDVLRRLQDQGCIQIIEKFGMVLYFTDVYVAYNQ